MEEIWKEIDGYENLYMVSSYGVVKSLGNDKGKKEKILKQQKDKIGYLFVTLCNNGFRKIYKIHRLVAETFIPNPDNLPQVNHKDENKHNNFVYINEDRTVNLEKSNLEWCTAKYNMNYGSRNERISEKHKRIKHTEETKEKISNALKGEKNPNYGKRWSYK